MTPPGRKSVKKKRDGVQKLVQEKSASKSGKKRGAGPSERKEPLSSHRHEGKKRQGTNCIEKEERKRLRLPNLTCKVIRRAEKGRSVRGKKKRDPSPSRFYACDTRGDRKQGKERGGGKGNY